VFYWPNVLLPFLFPSGIGAALLYDLLLIFALCIGVAVQWLVARAFRTNRFVRLATFFIVFVGSFVMFPATRAFYLDNLVYRQSEEPVAFRHLAHDGTISRLAIPRVYLSSRDERAGNPPDRTILGIEVAYPSMEPWRKQSAKSMHHPEIQKLEIGIRFNNASAKDAKPTDPGAYARHVQRVVRERNLPLLETRHGLEEYSWREDYGSTVLFPVAEPNSVLFSCGTEFCRRHPGPIDAVGYGYSFPKTHLPNWRLYEDKVGKLIASFRVSLRIR
jgi:hypothetical protein